MKKAIAEAGRIYELLAVRGTSCKSAAPIADTTSPMTLHSEAYQFIDIVLEHRPTKDVP